MRSRQIERPHQEDKPLCPRDRVLRAVDIQFHRVPVRGGCVPRAFGFASMPNPAETQYSLWVAAGRGGLRRTGGRVFAFPFAMLRGRFPAGMISQLAPGSERFLAFRTLILFFTARTMIQRYIQRTSMPTPETVSVELVLGHFLLSQYSPIAE